MASRSSLAAKPSAPTIPSAATKTVARTVVPLAPRVAARTPATTDGGIPAFAARSLRPFAVALDRWARRSTAVVRHALATAKPTTSTTNTSAPSASTTASTSTPGSISARRACPTGVSGETAIATSTATAALATPTSADFTVATRTALDRVAPRALRERCDIAVGVELTAQCLRDEHDPTDRHHAAEGQEERGLQPDRPAGFLGGPLGVAGAEVDEGVRVELVDGRGDRLGRRLGQVDPQLEARGPRRPGVAEQRAEARDVDPAVRGIERRPEQHLGAAHVDDVGHLLVRHHVLRRAEDARDGEVEHARRWAPPCRCSSKISSTWSMPYALHREVVARLEVVELGHLLVDGHLGRHRRVGQHARRRRSAARRTCTPSASPWRRD